MRDTERDFYSGIDRTMDITRIQRTVLHGLTNVQERNRAYQNDFSTFYVLVMGSGDVTFTTPINGGHGRLLTISNTARRVHTATSIPAIKIALLYTQQCPLL
jgi:hypothetical protein